MNIQEIQRLIKIVEKSKIDEIEVEEDKFKIRISKSPAYGGIDPAALHSLQLNTTIPNQSAPAAVPAPAPAAPAPAEAAPVEAAPDQSHLLEVLSPMVGTFYAAPAPDAAPYAKVGDIVKKGQVLCIVEAMKLMNEIESDFDGKIVEILVDNAQPVEYNHVLFRIEPV